MARGAAPDPAKAVPPPAASRLAPWIPCLADVCIDSCQQAGVKKNHEKSTIWPSRPARPHWPRGGHRGGHPRPAGTPRFPAKALKKEWEDSWSLNRDSWSLFGSLPSRDELAAPRSARPPGNAWTWTGSRCLPPQIPIIGPCRLPVRLASSRIDFETLKIFLEPINQPPRLQEKTVSHPFLVWSRDRQNGPVTAKTKMLLRNVGRDRYPPSCRSTPALSTWMPPIAQFPRGLGSCSSTL